ncbi:MAG: acyl-CoA dehydrogenase family protein [Actinobacteria bacterium]|nr:acyl-CoA dehydrogenase family protein [Actinomycetota bacterium]
MDFQLSEEQQAFMKSVREFAAEVVAPGAAERDREGRFDREVWDEVGRFGLCGLPVPEEHGGSGADVLTTGLALEALAYGGQDAGLNLSLGAHLTIGAMPIALHGTAEQKRRWLPGLASGGSIGAFAITEPGAGSDAAGITTTARQEGDVYVLNGAKTFCTNGSIADVITVIAVTEPEAPAGQKMTAFLVLAGTDGLSFGEDLHKMGNRSSPTSEVFLDDVEVPAAAVLGDVGSALWQVAFECFDWERTCMIASVVGGMERTLDDSITYAKEREAFGRPIGRFGAIQEKIADMRIRLEAARLLQREAAWLKDQGLDHQIQASIAKAFVGEAAVQSALDGVQLHGGWGYIQDFPVERGLRDAKLATIGGGTTEIQKMVIARSLLGG